MQFVQYTLNSTIPLLTSIEACFSETCSYMSALHGLTGCIC